MHVCGLGVCVLSFITDVNSVVSVQVVEITGWYLVETGKWHTVCGRTSLEYLLLC